MRLLAFCNLRQRNRWFEPRPLHFRWILLLEQILPARGGARSACAGHKRVARPLLTPLIPLELEFGAPPAEEQ